MGLKKSFLEDELSKQCQDIVNIRKFSVAPCKHYSSSRSVMRNKDSKGNYKCCFGPAKLGTDSCIYLSENFSSSFICTYEDKE